MLDLDSRALDEEYDLFRRKGMNRGLRFTIMHGNGNVIAVLDEALSHLAPEEVDSEFAREICQSFRSLRIDGIAFARPDGDRVRMTYFERDGTNSQMCGNALRCLTRYCAERGYISDEDVIATDDGEKWVSAADGLIRVSLGSGREFRKVAGDRYFVFSGLPHLVLLVDDLASVDVQKSGAALRYDTELCLRLNHPEGLHVDFMQRGRDEVAVRTYEVGVEAETLACGTGVAGSAFVANKVWGLPYPVRVMTRGGVMTVEDSRHGLLISGVTGYLFSTID